MPRSSLLRLRRAAVCAALLMALVVAPISTRQAARAAASGTLIIAISAEPDTLDPQVTGAAVTGQIDAYIGDPLVALSPQNKIVPDLAKSYTVSRDGLLYTF